MKNRPKKPWDGLLRGTTQFGAFRALLAQTHGLPPCNGSARPGLKLRPERLRGDPARRPLPALHLCRLAEKGTVLPVPIMVHILHLLYASAPKSKEGNQTCGYFHGKRRLFRKVSIG
ncbi:hypothetical protein SDC9_161130 [bioreactor metagenome]|uniref:Uncharacterized protein n=1 Tax=bioreactor metagenome TaxID=1076179 RepID=A0A645FNA6_9ZZZZ